MGLVFDDAQLRSISGEVLAIPVLIVSLNQQLTQAQNGKTEVQKKDNGNKAFSDFFRNTINSYHAELKHLNGTQKTDYLDATLDNSAKQAAGNLHYPTSPIWTVMDPKLLPENNGNPTSAFTPHEVAQVALVTAKIAQLKTGFTDGSTDDTLTVAYVNGVDVEVDTGPFVAGQRIVIDDAGVSLLATIVAVKPPSTTGFADLELNVIVPPLGALGLGARIRNFHPGFTNNEREGTTVPYAPEVMAYFKTEVDTPVTTWETTLAGQETALNTLDAGGAENTSRDAEKADIDNAQSIIDAWQAAPATGAGVGRYGNTGILPLENEVTARTTVSGTRVTEITTALGSVAQNPDGTFTGSGHYHSLFKWIVIRISKAGGTLFSFYNFDLVFAFINKQITMANNKQAEYNGKLSVKKFTDDADGTAFIKLIDTTGLVISDSVKIVDDSATPVLSATIVGISGLIVELSVPVSTFTVDGRARLVKLL